MIRRSYSIKQDLGIVSEWEIGSRECKAIVRRYELQPCQLWKWKKNREDVMAKASVTKDHTCRQYFLNKKTIHQGRKPCTSIEELDQIKKLHDDLPQRD
jgi:hypothetical protein